MAWYRLRLGSDEGVSAIIPEFHLVATPLYILEASIFLKMVYDYKGLTKQWKVLGKQLVKGQNKRKGQLAVSFPKTGL